jgi:hypothetical protein
MDYIDIPWANEEDDMVAVTIAVSSRWSAVGGVVDRSPRFSAFAIGFSC